MENHARKTFTFITKQGKEVQFTSRRYSFNLERKFIELIGKKVWDKYQKTGAIELSITPAKCKKDFLHLLEPIENSNVNSLQDIDWDETDISELAGVYFFFITFKQNVFTMQQIQLNETHASNLANLAMTLNLIPADALEKLNMMTTRSS